MHGGMHGPFIPIARASYASTPFVISIHGVSISPYCVERR